MSQRPRTYLPPDHPHVIPYLIVRRAPQLIGFLKTAFGATEELRTDLRDGTVTHARLRIRDSIILLCEARPDWPPMPSAVHLYVRNCDSAFDRAIAAGGTMLTPPTDSPATQSRTASIQDPSGNIWFLATHQASPASPPKPQVKTFIPSFAASRTPR
ncbi:MAG TPA: VOC family protein [Tepidisphaeraceae bacterium]|jgi:uncharacterized glyoxalase superfamily protein PhnB|nr:VOC family protein [Tepidisphaeraceae bacterium]